MKCDACGSELTVVERQLRAADEATQTTTSCPLCPVKTWKIDTVSMPVEPPRRFRLPIRRPATPRQQDYTGPSRTSYMIRMEVQKTSELLNIELCDRHVVTFDRLVHSRSLSDGSKSVRGETTIEGPGAGERRVLVDIVPLGLGVDLYSHSVQTAKSNDDSPVRVLIGAYCRINDVAGKPAVLYKGSGPVSTAVLVEIGFEKDDRIVASVIDQLYPIVHLPHSLSMYVSHERMSAFNNLSARAWDTSGPPEQGHVFTCKPDGERVWLVYYGKCWYHVPKSHNRSATKWLVNYTSDPSTSSLIVLDCEYVCGYGTILIDCLTDVMGSASPAHRDIRWVIETFQDIVDVHTLCPVTVRQYFDNYADALGYSSVVDYPVDGVVAIRDGSTEVLKIKDVKAVELCHHGGGQMFTSDDKYVVCLESPRDIGLGQIVELRFRSVDSSGKLNLVDSFVRTDKSSANSSDAVLNIFRSTLKTTTRTDDERRRALMWCNSVRSEVHRRSVTASQTRNIVLDVGTGTGQSIDTMSKDNSVSYILLEPDHGRCERLKRRLGLDRIVSDLQLLPSLIKRLKSRSLTHLVLNCTLNDLCNAEDVVKRLLPELKCLVATFSLQFVIEDVHALLSLRELPIYGCCYTYDNVNSSGVLVDACGVVMRTTDDDNAVVKWGGDEMYTEPTVMSRDLNGLGTVVLGSDIIELPQGADNAGVRSICSNVSVVLP